MSIGKDENEGILHEGGVAKAEDVDKLGIGISGKLSKEGGC